MTKVFSPYKVCVVVDREFGEQLATLALGVPVWIVDTPTNKAVAKRLWNERTHEDSLTGITTFHFSESATPEDMAVSMLDTIELHHGRHSAHPPFTVIEVLGTPLTESVKTGFSEYGFNEFDPTSTGFSATRPLPTD